MITIAFGRANEARLCSALHAAGDAEIGLVAERGNEVVGYLLLSRMRAPCRALGLAPLAVVPDAQRAGIGSALVEAAVARARAADWDAVFVLGDPAYYGRFGFSAQAASGYENAYAGAHFQALRLTTRPLPQTGRVDYAEAFAAL